MQVTQRTTRFSLCVNGPRDCASRWSTPASAHVPGPASTASTSPQSPTGRGRAEKRTGPALLLTRTNNPSGCPAHCEFGFAAIPTGMRYARSWVIPWAPIDRAAQHRGGRPSSWRAFRHGHLMRKEYMMFDRRRCIIPGNEWNLREGSCCGRIYVGPMASRCARSAHLRRHRGRR